MKSKNTEYLIIICVLIIGGILSWSFYFRVYHMLDTVDINHFPKNIGEWSSNDLPLSKLELDILETKNAFVRRYTAPGNKEIYLFIVYSQNNRKVAHPPEICYTGSGASILNSTRDSVALDKSTEINANRLIVEFKKTKQVIFYWFKVGDSFTASYWQQQFLIAMKLMTGKPSGSALIRLSAIIKDDEKTAVEDIKEFGKQITPFLDQYLP